LCRETREGAREKQFRLWPIFLVCIWRHNLSMSAILVDSSKFISTIKANRLGYFTISRYILKLTTMPNACIMSMSVSNACSVVHVFEMSTKMAGN
jgi:hypothetical protein